jgi:uncharacterized membrane protein YobD (UPF0266 family)
MIDFFVEKNTRSDKWKSLHRQQETRNFYVIFIRSLVFFKQCGVCFAALLVGSSVHHKLNYSEVMVKSSNQRGKINFTEHIL